MSSSSDLLKSIRESENGLTLAELLSAHTAIARRTAQRLIAKLMETTKLVQWAKAEPGATFVQIRILKMAHLLRLKKVSLPIFQCLPIAWTFLRTLTSCQKRASQ